MRSLLALALFVASTLGAAPGAAQQQQRYLVVPIAADEAVSLQDLAVVADDVRAHLRERGLDVLEPDVAAAVFEARVSTAAQRLTATQLDEIGTLVRDATRALSTGDLADAEARLERLGALRDAALEAVNRDASVARRALDGCLLGVRARLSAEDAGGALEMAERCRLMHPNVTWTENYHPDRVIEVYQEAGRQVDARGRARVLIEIPDVGERRCQARLNGVRIGDTFPVTVAQFRTGRASVQVECGETAGRIHRVEFQPGENMVRIDPLLDEAVSTDQQLGLRYAGVDRATWQAHLDELRQTVRATHVIGVVVYGFAQSAVSLQVRGTDGVIGVVEARRERIALHVDEALGGSYMSYLGDEPRDIRAQHEGGGTEQTIEAPERPGRDAGDVKPLPWVSIGGLWALGVASLWTAGVPPNDGLWNIDAGIFDGFGFSTGQKVSLVLGSVSVATAAVLTGFYGKRAGLRWLHYLSAGLLASASSALFGAHVFRVERRRFEEQERCFVDSQCAPVERFAEAQLGYFIGGLVAAAGAVGVFTWGLVLDRRERGERVASREDDEGDETEEDETEEDETEDVTDEETVQVGVGFGRLEIWRRF